LSDEEIRQQEKKTLRGNDKQELEDSYNKSSSENYDVEKEWTVRKFRSRQRKRRNVAGKRSGSIITLLIW
jgi:hypothetical protein